MLISLFSEDKLRKKWKYLRDQFGTELSKLTRPRSGSGVGAIAKSKWQYFDQLSFLRDVVQCRQSSGNLKQPTQSSETVSILPETREFYEEPTDPKEPTEEESTTQNCREGEVMETTFKPINVEPQTHSQRLVHVNPMPGSSRKRARPDEFNKSILELEQRKVDLLAQKISNRNCEEDENLLFFKSLLPHVRKICPGKMLSFRNKIQEVVQEYAYNQPISAIQSSSSFTPSPISIITFNSEDGNTLPESSENNNWI